MDGHKLNVLKAQFANATKSKHEYIKYAISDDITVWYILIHSMSGKYDEYVGGEYIFKMTVPIKNLESHPPIFTALTPNGLYTANKKVCISIGEFHSNNYPAVLGIRGFSEQLISGFVGIEQLGRGIALLSASSHEDRKKLALASKKYNYDNLGSIIKLIDESYDTYSAKWLPIETPVKQIELTPAEKRKKERLERKKQRENSLSYSKNA